jgi:ferredoxin
MIVAERKSIPELVEILKGHKKILVLGCGTCVTVCLAGGEREVSIISSALRIASKLGGQAFEIEELTIERQCDNVFIEQAAEAIEKSDAVLSLGCGAGVQAIAERYASRRKRSMEREMCSMWGMCIT